MKLLATKAIRDFKAIPAHVISIVIALAVVMTMPTGLEMALRSIVQGRDRFAQDLRLADLEVRMLPEDIKNLPSWKDIPDLESVDSRLLMPGTVALPNGKTIAALTVFLQSATPEINKIRLSQGAMFTYGNTEESVAERSLKSYAGIEPGSVLQVKIGQKTYEHRVTGIVSSPEFLIVAANPEYFLPEKGSLAVLYTSLQRVHENLGFTMVNDLVFRFRAGASPEKVKKAILARLGGRTIERVIPKDQHLSVRHIALDREIFGIFQPAIVTVLSFLAAALVLINIDRIVRRQQKEIGALLALGYSPSSVVLSYILAALLLAVAGIALGTLGALGFRNAFLHIYSNAHGLAYVESHLYWDVIQQGAVYVIAVALASSGIACWRLVRATPLSLIRPKIVSSDTLTFNQRLGILLSGKLPLPAKMAVRNVVRNLQLTVTTMLTVGPALAVALAYLVCLDSMGAAVSRSFDDQKWDRVVSFLYPALDDDYRALSSGNGGATEAYIRVQGQLASVHANQDVSILGMAPENSMRKVRLVSGRMAANDNEVVLSEDVARRLGVALGGSCELELRNQRSHVTVVGVKSDVMLGEVLAPFGWLQRTMELEDQATGAFVKFPPKANVSALDARIGSQDFTARSTPRTQISDEFRTVLQDIRKLVVLVSVIALAVAVLFIVMNLAMTMNERAGEFAVLRALGYDVRLIRRVVTIEATIHLCLALIVCAPLSYWLSAVLNARAGQAWFSQPTVYSPWLFSFVALGVFSVMLLSLIRLIRQFGQTSVVEGLRARIIE